MTPQLSQHRRLELAAVHAEIRRCELWLHPRDGGGDAGSNAFSMRGFDSAFGDAEVRTAIVAGHELRYIYVNESYRQIRTDVPMVGSTYRDVFPEAADAGAEARLRRVIATGKSWIVDDYPTPLPRRDTPAWWQGECVPISLSGDGTDAVFILLWDVTRRHLPRIGPAAQSREALRVAAARVKLLAKMAQLGWLPGEGWSISETVRETPLGTEWTFRPVHMRHPLPALHTKVRFKRR